MAATVEAADDAVPSSAESYRNIVFEGGGVLGVAYVGALRELQSRGEIDDLCGFAGSSVGSIAAAILACGASIDFIDKELRKLDIREFKDDSYNPFIDGYNLIHHYGFCKGDMLRKWCRRVLKDLTNNSDVTFQDVYTRYNNVLVITGTSLNTLSTVYFSHITHPRMKICDAIRISASIPYFFRAIHLGGDVFVDGGVLNNYPLSVFDGNMYNTARISPFAANRNNTPAGQTIDEFIQESVVNASHNATHNTSHITHSAACIHDTNPHNRTIGLKLVSSNEVKCSYPPVTGIKSYTTNLLNAMLAGIAQGHVRANDWARTIKINTNDISSIDFDLTDDQKEWLINQGKNAVIDFCDL